jgi:hypothetical protein
VVDSGAACEKMNVFPGESRVHRHVVDLGAKVSCPLCFGNEYFILDVFVEAGESITHCIGDGGRKSGRGAKGVDQLVAFVDWGLSKIASCASSTLIQSAQPCAFWMTAHSLITEKPTGFYSRIYTRDGLFSVN